ncbi:MAG TPA: response regulator [Caulobacteraceae bacterium]|nr:response regulator [Caulobacteraceae bacterium]
MQQSFDANGPRILVVEDDPMMLELICTRLSLAGYRTAHARDGHEGLDRLRDQKFDAMILDINMPRLDGFGVLEQMKAVGNRTPTMVLTARNQSADVQRAIQLGARDFLSKPFEDQKLLSRVARLTRPTPTRQPSAPPSQPVSRIIW